MPVPAAAQNISLPHDFSEFFKESSPAPAIFFCGSGFSFKLVDSVWDLLRKCSDAALKLNCSSLECTEENEEQYLYLWAQDIEGQLLQNGELYPKLKIAKALGLMDDDRWLGETGTKIPLSAHSARHRVAARFARDKVWQHFWTLNWDCFLEKALECVGFQYNDDSTRTSDVPWSIHYLTFITVNDVRNTGNEIVIYKPNGCVNALFKAENSIALGNNTEALSFIERFLITQSELTQRDNTLPANQTVWANLQTDLEWRLLLAIGWSMSEKYLKDIVKSARNEKNKEEQKLTIVDVTFNNDGHTEVSNYYKLPKQNVFVDVSGQMNANQFFLWLQAKYVIHKFKALDVSGVENLEPYTENPEQKNSFIEYSDSFLPAWTRLCSRSGLVEWVHNGSPIAAEKINMEVADYYIPMSTNLLRPDLRGAANLILQIIQSNKGETWNFRKVPGCLWNEEKGNLVIPLPAWSGDDSINKLRAFSPLAKEVDNIKGFIRRLSILPVHYDNGKIIDDTIKTDMKSYVVNFSTHAAISRPDSVDIIALTDL